MGVGPCYIRPMNTSIHTWLTTQPTRKLSASFVCAYDMGSNPIGREALI